MSTEYSKPGLVVYAYNFTTQEAEARGSRVRGQVWLQISKQSNQDNVLKIMPLTSLFPPSLTSNYILLTNNNDKTVL